MSTRPVARPSTLARAISLMPRLVRLATFSACVGIAVVLLAARAGAVQLRGELLSLGREMMRYGPPGESREARQLAFNGARLGVATGFTTDALTTVLDEYVRRCESRDGSSDVAAASPTAHGARTTTPAIVPGTPRSTLRQEDGPRGFVACFDVGGSAGNPLETLRRIRAVADSGDLRQLGGLRYLYAERSRNGRTRFLTLWSDGELNVRRMFPTTGDAPGEDPPGVPRAAGLRRIIDAHEVGGPQALWVFSGHVDRSAIERHYREAMRADGWTISNPTRAPAGSQTLLAFDRGAVNATIVIDGVDADTHATVFLSH